jgi:hypothetical protein
MKNVILVFALVLCTCTLAAAVQAPSAPGTGMDKATFLQSLQVPAPVLASSRAGSRDRLPTKSSCTVSLTCDVGAYPLSCSSANGDCQAGSTWVKCDGVQQDCPVCYKTRTCCDNSVIECYGWTSCGFGGTRSVVCDGQVEGTCPPLSQCAR